MTVHTNKADVLLSLQFGDEGKGAMIDRLAPEYDILARWQGGPNAGHTLEVAGKKYVLHQIPSGILYSDKINYMGSGMVVDPVILRQEIEKIREHAPWVEEKLILSRYITLIVPTHILLDKGSETAKGDAKVGTTQKGIGPAYESKVGRKALMIGTFFDKPELFHQQFNEITHEHVCRLNALGYPPDLEVLEESKKRWFEALDGLRILTYVDGHSYIFEQLQAGKKVLAEGAQGAGLDINYGTYPMVTSSEVTIGGLVNSLGISPWDIGVIYAVSKAYCTRVGSGPFPTEYDDDLAEEIRQKGREFGATTGRPRRIGHIDLPFLKKFIRLNGVRHTGMLVITKADVLSDLQVPIKICIGYNNGNIEPMHDLEGVVPEYREFPSWDGEAVKRATKYDELPVELRNYLQFIQDELEVPIGMLSLGPNRENVMEVSIS